MRLGLFADQFENLQSDAKPVESCAQAPRCEFSCAQSGKLNCSGAVSLKQVEVSNLKFYICRSLLEDVGRRRQVDKGYRQIELVDLVQRLEE